MKVGMMVGLGLGIASVFGCTHDVSDANVPPVPAAAAPTPLVPEAYTVLAAAVAPAASPPAQMRSLPAPARDPVVVAQDVPAPAPAVAARAAPAPAVPIVGAEAAPSPASKPNQYHPYWMVDVH